MPSAYADLPEILKHFRVALVGPQKFALPITYGMACLHSVIRNKLIALGVRVGMRSRRFREMLAGVTNRLGGTFACFTATTGRTEADAHLLPVATPRRLQRADFDVRPGDRCDGPFNISSRRSICRRHKTHGVACRV